MKKLVTFMVLLICFPLSAFGESLSIVTWNIDGSTFDGRSQEFKRFASESKPDIVLLQELLGEDQLKTFVSQAGLGGWHHYISDFSKDSLENNYSKLEVGIASKFDLTNRYEADPIQEKGDNEDVMLRAPSFLPADQTKSVGARGYLWAEIPTKKLVVVAVHLKSSQGRYGNEDVENSFKREGVVAAVAEHIKQHQSKVKGYSYIVAGDFNIAPGDYKKVGPNINKRCGYDCRDYDQTHALIGGGLIDGFIMRNLTVGLTNSYKGKDGGKNGFVKSPIDNIYVIGPLFDEVTKMTAERLDSYGSDHYAVRVEVHYAGH